MQQKNASDILKEKGKVFVEDFDSIVGRVEQNVYVGNDYHVVGVEKFRNISKKDKNVDFSYDGVSYKDIVEGEKISLGEDYLLVNKWTASCKF